MPNRSWHDLGTRVPRWSGRRYFDVVRSTRSPTTWTACQILERDRAGDAPAPRRAQAVQRHRGELAVGQGRTSRKYGWRPLQRGQAARVATCFPLLAIAARRRCCASSACTGTRGSCDAGAATTRSTTRGCAGSRPEERWCEGQLRFGERRWAYSPVSALRALERRPWAVVAGLTALAALLRFATLGDQSFWLDESATVDVLGGPWADMFDELSSSEATPPVYYVLAKAWTGMLGSGEAGLRSLSALAGTLTVPVAYLLGREAASEQAGLVAAGGLVAVHPYLVWYSQEARAYALFALLATCSLLFFARVLEHGVRRSLVAWTVFAALTMATHYFGGFLVAAEALWLVARGPRRSALVASAVLAAVALALLPLVLEQRSQGGNQAWIVERSLGQRLDATARGFLAGETTRRLRGAVPLAALLACIGAVLLLGRERLAERRGLVAIAVVTVAAAAIPVTLALFDADYVVSRNFLFGLVAALVLLAAGLATGRAGRLGMAVALALFTLYAVLDVKAVRDESLQRDDWSAAVSALGRPPASACSRSTRRIKCDRSSSTPRVRKGCRTWRVAGADRADRGRARFRRRAASAPAGIRTRGNAGAPALHHRPLSLEPAAPRGPGRAHGALPGR